MGRGRKKKHRNKGKCQKGLETMIMGIDHGYYAIKTRHFSFPAGVTAYGRFVQDPYPGVSINPAYHFPYAVVAITSSQRADTARPVCS